ncbi:MAG: isopenicillin N synthase family oxygenase [Alphaproteobacteria bacterium]|nr:isopenicillin N synthase family oxygenase [Alphaproteobacteria bacterium]
MQIYTPPKTITSIPVIDLAGADTPAGAQRTAEAIHRACRETGFFYVSSHGVPPALIAAQFEAARQFFALSDAEKMALHMRNSPSTAGYEPIGGQVLDSQDDKAEMAPADLKEGFYAGPDFPDDHPLVGRHIRNFGHNQWPLSLPQFRPQMLAYLEAVRALGDRLLTLLAVSLELESGWFMPFFAEPTCTLRIIHYPPHPANAAANQLGAGAHTDWGGITMLAQDDTGGLEVRTTAGDWIEATPIPDTFIINLGDLMMRWTNGLYRSTMHRVKNKRPGIDRYSVPFFYGPSPDSVIEPIPTCVDAEHPRQFATCTAAEHTYEMFKRSYGYAPAA